MSRSARIVWLDIAKGICMLAVIAGHLGQTDVNKIVFAFHLTLFFILSGFTLKPEISSESASKRFLRLMRPYLITCTAILVMDVINLIVINKVTDTLTITQEIFSDIVRSFFGSGAYTRIGAVNLPGRIGAIWFLPAMFFATVLTQLLLKHVKDIRHRYIVALAAAVFATVSGSFAWFPFSLQSAIFAVPFIMLGYDARQYGLFEKIRLRHALISLCVFAVGFYMSLTQISFVTASMNDILFTPIFAISASVVIVYVSQKLEFMRPLAFVGKYSMYYLCIHLFEMETTGYWFIELLKLLNIPVCPLSMFIVRVIYGTLMTFAVIGITRLFTYLKKQPKPSGNRDCSLDVEKGILIILMIIGHFSMYRGLRNIIYSFHMPAFILLSGYMFKSKACDTLLRSVMRLVRSFLLPYAVFAVGHVILAPGLVQNKLLSVLFGISFKKVLFQDIAGIGAMWFVLLLFVIRVVYLIMCRLIKNEYALHGAVLLVTFIGYFISKQGWWLPWSVDVALFSIIFYHIGRMLKQYNVLEYIASRPYFYFLLTPIWAYVVFACPIELATRAYGVAGFSILGGIMGTLVVYMLSRYVLNSCGRIIGRIMCAIGRNTLYILILYSLFSTMVKHGLTDIFGLTDGYIYHMIATVAVIVIAGTAVGLVKESISKLFSKSS